MAPSLELKALEQAVARDLELLTYPAKEWVARPEEHGDVLDCAIIGGGQLGLSVAFGLLRERVTNIRVFDANPAGHEGPWITFARMETLRTPKVYSGPEHGFASLSFRAWYEAAYGPDAWDAIEKIPRQHWMEYLVWFRHVLDLPVQNDADVTACVPDDAGLFCLSVSTPDGPKEVRAKTVVFATGAFGTGRDFTPSVVSDLPRSHWRHANEVFDHGLLRGKRVGVLGAGASAFDAAATALEHGAVAADICFRRPEFPMQNPRRFLESAGFLAQYRELPDDLKWRCGHHLHGIGQPPPAATYARAMSKGATLRPASPWVSARCDATGAIKIDTGTGSRSGTLAYDFVIAATGSEMDLAHRPELAAMVGDIAVWGDRYTAPEGMQSAFLASHPYQSTRGQLTEKVPGTAPWLNRAFMVNGASGLSLGPTVHSCAALRYAAPMVVRGVVNELFQQTAATVVADLVGQLHPEAGLEDLYTAPFEGQTDALQEG